MGSRGNRRDADGKFLTDTDISRASGPVERPLEAWVDTSAPDPSIGDLSLASAHPAAKPRQWNQFAANERMFGIVPSYDEHLYTTEVNTQHPDYQARERRAAQLAKEIESKQYGASLDDGAADEIDEEDQYSGVARISSQTGKRQRNRNPPVADLAKFAANEAQKALASPQYLAEQERSARQADKLSNDKLPKDKLSNTSASPNSSEVSKSDSEPSGDASLEVKRRSKPSKPSVSSSESGKKKFNFSAASFKHTSFSPSPKLAHQPRPGSASPSPGPLGSTPPVLVPPMMSPIGAPLATPLAAPLHPAMPFMPAHSGMPMPMPLVSPPAIPFADPAEYARPTQPVDTASLRKFTAEDYNFVASQTKKQEPLPKIFFTPPTWTGPGSKSGDVFYADQFSSGLPATRPPMVMVPSGFMMPRFV